MEDKAVEYNFERGLHKDHPNQVCLILLLDFREDLNGKVKVYDA